MTDFLFNYDKETQISSTVSDKFVYKYSLNNIFIGSIT